MLDNLLLKALLAPAVHLLAAGSNTRSMVFAETVYHAGCVLMRMGEWLIEQRASDWIDFKSITERLQSAAEVDVQTIQEASLSNDFGCPVPPLETVIGNGN